MVCAAQPWMPEGQELCQQGPWIPEGPWMPEGQVSAAQPWMPKGQAWRQGCAQPRWQEPLQSHDARPMAAW